MDNVIKNYPRKDYQECPRYVRYPVFDEGKWKAADVMEGGYMIPLRTIGFDTQKECQKACDIENKFWGYTPEDVARIISWSMSSNKKAK